MKPIIFFIFCFSLCHTAIAQPPPSGSYRQDTALNKFVGTWQWVSGTDTVTIVFQKQKMYYPSPANYYVDALVGWHKYTKSGKLIESYLGHSNTPFDQYSTFIGNSNATNSLSVTLFSQDFLNHKGGEVYLTLVPNKTTQGQWNLHNKEGIKVSLPGQPPFITGFTLPTSMVMTKIK